MRHRDSGVGPMRVSSLVPPKAFRAVGAARAVLFSITVELITLMADRLLQFVNICIPSIVLFRWYVAVFSTACTSAWGTVFSVVTELGYF